MFQRFFPNEYYDSTYHIDFQAFYDKGYRAVLFDVDNTLVEHDAPANARAKALIQKLKDMGYTYDEVLALKEHYRSEIARTREEELSLRKEIRVAESIIKEIEEEDRDIDKIEEKEISRDEQPRL